MAKKYTVTANYNDPFFSGLRDRGDVVEVDDGKPDDDDPIAKGRARHTKDLVSRGLLLEGEHTTEDLDKRDAAEAKKKADADKAGDGSEPQTVENVENDPNAPQAPADALLAPGVAAKDVPGGEDKLKAGAKTASK